MYHRDHPPPHFHVRYGGQKGRISIRDLRVMDGNLSPRASGLVLEWAALHQEELLRDWDLAVQQQPTLPIAPYE